MWSKNVCFSCLFWFFPWNDAGEWNKHVLSTNLSQGGPLFSNHPVLCAARPPLRGCMPPMHEPSGAIAPHLVDREGTQAELGLSWMKLALVAGLLVGQGRRQHGCSGCICTHQIWATGTFHRSLWKNCFENDPRLVRRGAFLCQKWDTFFNFEVKGSPMHP